jgi:CubicO group peptidase (beta-lactamase class C family)
VQRFDEARALVRDAIGQRTTPGAQLSVRWRSRRTGAWERADFAEGALSYDDGSPPATLDTKYDLASVTKAIFALAAVSFATREGLSLETRARDLWPESAGTDAGEVTLDSLLSHRGELAAWAPLFQEITARDAGTPRAREAMLSRLLGEPLERNGGVVRYSDLGYITAGEAISRASGLTLGALIEQRVLAPLREAYGALSIGYRPLQGEPEPDVAPTEQCAWRATLVRGVVHDENAYGLGGQCGHAGLFGTARDLAIVGEASLRALLEGEGSWFAPDAMRAMTDARPGGTHRLGWDGKSLAGSSAGARASLRTFGHLGFTGTMLWCDPDAGVSVALVTNRVHPTRENNGIRALRPAVMDSVLRAISE